MDIAARSENDKARKKSVPMGAGVLLSNLSSGQENTVKRHFREG